MLLAHENGTRTVCDSDQSSIPVHSTGEREECPLTTKLSLLVFPLSASWRVVGVFEPVIMSCCVFQVFLVFEWRSTSVSCHGIDLELRNVLSRFSRLFMLTIQVSVSSLMR